MMPPVIYEAALDIFFIDMAPIYWPRCRIPRYDTPWLCHVDLPRQCHERLKRRHQFNRNSREVFLDGLMNASPI